jgi:hypothetical protein
MQKRGAGVLRTPVVQLRKLWGNCRSGAVVADHEFVDAKLPFAGV